MTTQENAEITRHSSLRHAYDEYRINSGRSVSRKSSKNCITQSYNKIKFDDKTGGESKHLDVKNAVFLVVTQLYVGESSTFRGEHVVARFCWFISWPWRWRSYVNPQLRPFSEVHDDIITQKTFTVTTVTTARTSNPAIWICSYTTQRGWEGLYRHLRWGIVSRNIIMSLIIKRLCKY
jgi:hypothetical protein